MKALSAAESGLLQSLARRRVREREGLFLAEGVRVVEELLEAGIALRLAVLSSSLEDTERGAAVAARLASRTEVRRVADHELARLAPTETPQGVLVAASLPAATLDELDVPERALGLVLDGVQDPGNLGTLARTAEAFGAAFLAALPGTVDPWNPKAVRGAAGALFRLPVVQPNVDALLSWLAEWEMALWAADSGGVPVRDLARPARVALAVGNEGAGLGAALRAASAARVGVPIRAGTESLNVAVAAGILLHELAVRG